MLTLRRRRTRERTVLDIELDRILAGERAASAELYPTRRRDVLGVPKEAPAALDMPGRATHRSDDERHGF